MLDHSERKHPDFSSGDDPPFVQKYPSEASGTRSPALPCQPKEHDIKLDAAHKAQSLRLASYAEHMNAILERYNGKVGFQPYVHMMKQNYLEYGSPQDPMVMMLIQQAVFFHELIPYYHRRAVESKNLQEAALFLKEAHTATEDHRKTSAQLMELVEKIHQRKATETAQPDQAAVYKNPERPMQEKKSA